MLSHEVLGLLPEAGGVALVGPDQAGAAFREFVTWFYQENRLVQNCVAIGGRKIDLRALRLPMLNLIGTRDHLVPPDASLALQRLVGSADYTALEFDLGHIGMYISARAQREVPAAIANLLGDEWIAADGSPKEPKFDVALSVPGVRLHLYEKLKPRKGRKMGHLSAVGATPVEAVRRVLEAKELL